MNYRTEIKIQDDKFFVDWRSGPDPESNDDEIEEEEKSKERKIDT